MGRDLPEPEGDGLRRRLVKTFSADFAAERQIRSAVAVGFKVVKVVVA